MLIFFLVSVSALFAQKADKLHFSALVADTHNDILTTICTDSTVDLGKDMTGKTYSDLARFRKGGVDWQFFSVWCDGNQKDPYQWANREIDSLYAAASRYPDQLGLAGSVKDLKRLVREGKLAAMFGVEGGHMIEGKLDNLDSLYRRGVRYMTLTWNNSTDWATSAMDETEHSDSLDHKGLTPFGKQVVQRMNRLGMLVDLSHTGEATFWDAIHTTTRPVLVSHSCAYRLCPVFRNLKDDQIRAVGANGGVICVNFYSGFVDSTFFRKMDAFNEEHRAERDSVIRHATDPYFADLFLSQKYKEELEAFRPPLSLLMDHIDYLVRLAGVDHVGLGSDFDGITSSPRKLDDVTSYPLITAALQERGYNKKDIRKILGGNLLRLYKENQR